jgi:hypothetical protein
LLVLKKKCCRQVCGTVTALAASYRNFFEDS